MNLFHYCTLPMLNCYSVLPLICKNEVQQEQLHKDTCCQAGQWSCRWASNQQLCLNSCSLIHWHGWWLVNSGQVTNCWLTSQSTCFLSSWLDSKGGLGLASYPGLLTPALATYTIVGESQSSTWCPVNHCTCNNSWKHRYIYTRCK